MFKKFLHTFHDVNKQMILLQVDGNKEVSD